MRSKCNGNCDIETIRRNTARSPVWLHFGAGNLFRGFLAAAQQKLIYQRVSDRGIIAAEAFDLQIIDRIYRPHDNLSWRVLMGMDGTWKQELITSVTESLKADPREKEQWQRLREIFRNPSLQMVSFTITEKGYALRSAQGDYLSLVRDDLAKGPKAARHTLSVLTSMLFERYQAGGFPLAAVSMDNCARNGEKLRVGVMEIAEVWAENGMIDRAFLDYLGDEERVSFPWTMIDKITPNPSEAVRKRLAEQGLTGMEIVETATKTLIAPFVNAEEKEYLVIEDRFPGGRPELEKAGIFFADRETVDRAEKMKVGTCLNPLHTALAIFGCLLGYEKISDEMQDGELVRLIQRIAYDEAMPVCPDPGIINPREFVREVLEERFPNPFIPDTPQRIAADTSQKIPIRFGKTLQSYQERADLDIRELTAIPFVFAGWCRYLLGTDDQGQEMTLSPDPMLPQLTESLQGISVGKLVGYREKLAPILENEAIFGVNLHQVGLAETVEKMFCRMAQEPGGVRNALTDLLQGMKEKVDL